MDLSRPNTYLTWIIPAIALLLRLLSSSTADYSYILIAIYALFGRVQAIQALGLSWLTTMLNPGIAAEITLGSIGRHVVIAAATISIIFRNHVLIKRSSVRPMTFATLLLGLFFIFHSLFISPIMNVSVLKALSWTVVMATIISAWLGLEFHERDMISRQILGGMIIVMMTSLPLLLVPVGYLRNGLGFQGILNHPQAFGSTMALLGAWVTGLLLGQQRKSWRLVALSMTTVVLIFMSEARTAGLAMFLGVSFAVMSIPVFSQRPIRLVLPGLQSRRVYLLIAVGLIVFIATGRQLSAHISEFMIKRSQATSIQEAFEISRGHLIRDMWENISANPVTGIGFGIASNPEQMIIQRDQFFDLPIGATIEKGVLPIAVLEETGIMGCIAVAMWVAMIARRSIRGGVIPLAVTLTVFLLNLGESSLFSPGGMGLLHLILLGWAVSAPDGQLNGNGR